MNHIYDWEDLEAEPNGIGPTCKHCKQLIDKHPFDHNAGCPGIPDPLQEAVAEINRLREALREIVECSRDAGLEKMCNWMRGRALAALLED